MNSKRHFHLEHSISFLNNLIILMLKILTFDTKISVKFLQTQIFKFALPISVLLLSIVFLLNYKLDFSLGWFKFFLTSYVIYLRKITLHKKKYNTLLITFLCHSINFRVLQYLRCKMFIFLNGTVLNASYCVRRTCELQYN